MAEAVGAEGGDLLGLPRSIDLRSCSPPPTRILQASSFCTSDGTNYGTHAVVGRKSIGDARLDQTITDSAGIKLAGRAELKQSKAGAV